MNDEIDVIVDQLIKEFEFNKYWTWEHINLTIFDFLNEMYVNPKSRLQSVADDLTESICLKLGINE